MTDVVDKGLKRFGISVSTPVLAVICIVFGAVLFIFPELVGYIIGLFLLIQGIILLVDYYSNTHHRSYRTPPQYSY